VSLEIVTQCAVFADSVVSVHDLTVFAQITCLTKSRGATLFAVDLQQVSVPSQNHVSTNTKSTDI